VASLDETSSHNSPWSDRYAPEDARLYITDLLFFPGFRA